MVDKKYAAQERYISKTIRVIKLSLNRNTDADILTFVESLPNMQGYLKGLIRADMARKGSNKGEEK